jgi:hemolysin III
MTDQALALPPKPLLRGWSHVVGFVVALSIGVVLIAAAPAGAARVSIVIYVFGLCTMLGVSSLYHRVRWDEKGLAFMRRLDHSTIFLAIAGTYTPIAVICLEGWARTAVLVGVWGGTAVGIAIQWVPFEVPRWAYTAVYALVGWVAFIALPELYAGLGPVGFGLVLAGGISYTLGAIVYATKWPDPWPRVFGFHEVFHAFTVIGAGLHLAAIAFVVLPKA